MSDVKHKKLGWSFLSSTSLVLVCLSSNPTMKMKDVAKRVGITERSVQRIVAELEAMGVLKRTRIGRQNRYEIDPGVPMRHELEAHRSVGDLLETLLPCEALEVSAAATRSKKEKREVHREACLAAT
ncbi:MAG: winged helix-turn-helix transcriptional regulator [Armatimonadetes bacterium]|nr:winged helix-turn-helix transcriptional regulator [Armatimonadota bacterium]